MACECYVGQELPVVLPDGLCIQECLEGVLGESWASYD